MRTPFITANWKMHKTIPEALAFARELKERLKDPPLEVAIAPPFTALAALAAELTGSPIQVAAQDLSPEPQGAFTGEISAAMLVDAGCSHVIVGHSERRTLFGESDALAASKVRAAQAVGLVPILCVGERLEEREAGRTSEVLGRQLDRSLEGAGSELVIAYEPVWAIGTGRTATPELAQEVHGSLRGRLCERFAAAGDAIRIQYGGSVKPGNAAALLAQPDVDGALVGGASLDPESFSAIIRCDESRQETGR